MRRLISCLEDLQSKLERFRKLAIKETPTRTVFIDPILEALGWDVRDPDEVELEYPTVAGKFVDYALKFNRKPVLFVEAKALCDSLTDLKAIAQVIGYAANAGVVWCILTNGVQWKVFRSVEKCEAPDKLMFEVSFDPRDSEGVELSQLAQQMWRFSREEMAQGTLDAIGEQTFTDSKIRKALDRLIRDPPRKLINLLRDAVRDKDLRPQQIKQSLARICPSADPATGLMRRYADTPRARVEHGQASARPQSVQRTSKANRTKGRSTYDEAHHTAGIPREVLELYEAIDRFCAGVAPPGGITKRYMARYIAYACGGSTFCYLMLQQGGLRVKLPLKYSRIRNPPAFARDLSHRRGGGRPTVMLAISEREEINNAVRLIGICLEGILDG